MIFKLFLILLLLVVNARKRLSSVPDTCSVPKSPPTCLYSTATPYFISCGIYNGGDCPRFWLRSTSTVLGETEFPSPMLSVHSLVYRSETYTCDLHVSLGLRKEAHSSLTLDWIKKIGASGRRLGWKASNIKALIYLSVNRRGFVTSRFLVYTYYPPESRM